MSTQVSPGAVNVMNAALFSEHCKKPTFSNLLTGPAPKAVKSGGSRRQTDSGAPIVRVTDLEKEAGDEVSVDIYHELTGLPTMGDKLLEGRSEAVTQAADTIKINQGRKPVDSGGKMTQKRTKHNIRKAARTLLGNYDGRLSDELTLVHLAGGRGDFATSKTILPLEDHDEFSELVVNPIRPPTFNRHSYGGDATALDNIDAADTFSLEALDMLHLIHSESGSPLQPIALAGDEMAHVDPMFILYCTPRQWYDLNNSASGKDWNQMAAKAINRSKGLSHLLFRGDMVMRKNILVKPMTQTVRFSAGSRVKASKKDRKATEEIRVPGVHVERAIMLGGQAMAHALGNIGSKGTGIQGHYTMKEIETDAGNRKQQILTWMDGRSKIRFADSDGWLTDHGVHVVDTAVSTDYMNL